MKSVAELTQESLAQTGLRCAAALAAGRKVYISEAEDVRHGLSTALIISDSYPEATAQAIAHWQQKHGRYRQKRLHELDLDAVQRTFPPVSEPEVE